MRPTRRQEEIIARDWSSRRPIGELLILRLRLSLAPTARSERGTDSSGEVFLDRE